MGVLVVRPPRDLLPPPTPVTRTPSSALHRRPGSSARRERLQLRCQAEARNSGVLLAAVGVVPRARRGGGGAEAAAAEAEAQDAAGPARRHEAAGDGDLPTLRLRLAGRRVDGAEDAEQGAGERVRAAQHVAAARHGVRRVARVGPGGGRRGALRQGRPPAAAAVGGPGRLRTPLLAVQLGEFGPI